MNEVSEFTNVTILLPTMDETYSLKETVDVILTTCESEDIAEIIILLCDRTSKMAREVTESLVRDYKGKGRVHIHDQTLPFVGGAI